MDVVVSPEFESWLSIKRAQDSESKLGALKPYAIVERLGLASHRTPSWSAEHGVCAFPRGWL